MSCSQNRIRICLFYHELNLYATEKGSAIKENGATASHEAFC